MNSTKPDNNISETQPLSGQVEEKLTRLFMQAPAAIALLEGPDHVYTFVNPLYEKLYSRNQRDLLGKTVREAFPEIAGQGVYELFDKVFNTGEPYTANEFPTTFIYEGEQKTGYYNFVIQPIKDERERTTDLMVHAYEVTKQVEGYKKIKDSEEQLKLITDAAPLLISYVDREYRYRFNNKTYEIWIGRDLRDIVGKTMEEVLGEKAFKNLKDKVDQALSGKRVQFETIISYKDGEERYISGNYIPHFSEAGEVLGFYVVISDLTDRKQVEISLSENEAKFRHLIQSNIVGVLFWDFDKGIVDANDAFLNLVGYTKEDMKGELDWRTITPPQWRHHDDEGERQLLETGRHMPFEKQYLHKKGYPVDVIIASSAFEGTGNRKGVTFVLDISERKRAEQAVRESEGRFQNLVRDATAAIIVLTGKEMKVEIANEAYGKLIGLKPENLLGKHLFDLIPEAREYYLPILENVRQTGHPRTLYDSPYSVVTNGVKIEGYLHMVYQPYKNTLGEIVGVMALIQDVTDSVKAKKALEESESRFRSVIEQSTLGKAVLEGPEWTLTLVNDHMLELWQRDRSIVGKKLLEFMPELVGQPFPALLKNVYETGITHQEYDAHVVLNRNGKLETVYMDYSYKALRNLDGEVYAILVAASDVTDRFFARKKLEESENQFRHLSEKLEEEVDLRTSELKQSNENLQQFAHVASHDLKEPVRKIKTFATLLKEELGDKLHERGNLYLQKIQHSTDRMVSMIDGVLAYSSINAEVLQNEKVDLNEIIENIKDDLEVIIAEKRVNILVKNLPTVEGARVLIHQLFYNLLNNSIKFSAQEQAPRVLIEAEYFSRNGQDAVRIIVQDNGIGFEQKFANTIFNTFTRLNSKDKYEGTGLGLALCKKIVARHNGTIEASGEKGKGAKFIVELPIKQY